MNIKSLLIYLAVLITLSFNAFALEVQEKQKVNTLEPMSSVVTIALNQESSPEDYLAPPIANSQKISQASAGKTSEFITELSVYLIIIVIYSIYGFKVNSKNVRN